LTVFCLCGRAARGAGIEDLYKDTLHGAEIIDRWKDPADGSLFSLCEMDLFAFKNALDEYQELDAQVRDYVRKNAQKLHSELERMERGR
jgi:hypothetical protein